MKLREISKNKKGFTFIEILLVVGMLGLVVSVTVPSMGKLQVSSQLNSATEQVEQAINLAQQRSAARLNGSAHGVYFDDVSSPNRVIVYQGDSYASRDAGYDKIITLAAAISINTTLSSNDLAFAAGVGTANESSTTTISSQATSDERTIIINKKGIIHASSVAADRWQMPTDGLMIWYKFNDATTDSSTNFNTGSCSNCPDIEQTSAGENYGYFDGSSDQISVPDDDSLATTNKITYGGWIRRDDGQLTSWPAPFVQGGSTQTFLFYVHNTSDLGYCNKEINGSTDWLATNTLLSASSSWYHIMCTYDGDNAEVYVNGVLDNSEDATDGTLTQTTEPVYIGGYNYKFKGGIDEFAAWNRVLDSTEIANIYANQVSNYTLTLADQLKLWYKFDDTTTNSAPGASNGTCTNCPTIAQTANAENYSEYDGEDDHVDTGINTRTMLGGGDSTADSFTVSVWANPSSLPNENSWNKAPVSAFDYANGQRFYITYHRTDEYWFYGLGDTNSNNISTSATGSEDTWQHVVWTYDTTLSSNNLKIYVDAVLKYQTTYSGDGTLPNKNPYIGCSNIDYGDGCYNDFRGGIDDVRIWSRSLGSSEISSLYNDTKGEYQ